MVIRRKWNNRIFSWYTALIYCYEVWDSNFAICLIIQWTHLSSFHEFLFNLKCKNMLSIWLCFVSSSNAIYKRHSLNPTKVKRLYDFFFKYMKLV